MSTETPETLDDSLYNLGYDDGYNGRAQRNQEPHYLEGFYEGEDDAGYDDDGWDYDYGYDYDEDDEDD